MKEFKVALDDIEAEIAIKLGDGDLCLGIRRAVILAGLRAEKSVLKECAVVNQTHDQLTIVTDQMAALADELKDISDDSPRREEIAKQLIRLGKLYLSITANTVFADEDR